MRKITIISVIALAICAFACTNGEKKSENLNKQEEETMQTKTLVTYFSASGVTKQVAKQLAETCKADIHEIIPDQIYTEADLDWTDSLSRSSVEMKDKTSRPKIKKSDLNITGYDIIFVGFPIWWYTCPTIINTFMESYDFSNKTVIPFATSGGSTIEQACKDLKETYPNANWKEGKLLNNATKEELEEWTNNLFK